MAATNKPSRRTTGGSPADPARGLALLWGAQDRPGRSGLTVRAIVVAAIGIADTAGLDALSMRRVAEELGVGTMSLYTHVPGRSELVDLMTDTVVGELYDGPDALVGLPDWRAALREIARRNWALYERHPWVAGASGARPVLGPRISEKYEIELGPLDGIGLTDLEIDAVLALVLTHVEGTARAHLSQRAGIQESGETDEQWWEATAPLLAQVMDRGRFPLSGRVGQAVGQEYRSASAPEQLFEFGLERILDGVAVLIDQRG